MDKCGRYLGDLELACAGAHVHLPKMNMDTTRDRVGCAHFEKVGAARTWAYAVPNSADGIDMKPAKDKTSATSLARHLWLLGRVYTAWKFHH
jgi:hypothetical protein